MMEVAGEDFESHPLPGRIVLDDLERLVHEQKVDIRTDERLRPDGEGGRPKHAPTPKTPSSGCVTSSGRSRAYRTPGARRSSAINRRWASSTGMTRDEIIARLEGIREANEMPSCPSTPTGT